MPLKTFENDNLISCPTSDDQKSHISLYLQKPGVLHHVNTTCIACY